MGNKSYSTVLTNKIPQEENKIIKLIRLTYTKVMIIEILEINNIQSKSTPMPLITLKTRSGLSCKWLFDTGAALSCVSIGACRKILHRPLIVVPKKNVTGH
jgi:hypothetical protein